MKLHKIIPTNITHHTVCSLIIMTKARNRQFPGETSSMFVTILERFCLKLLFGTCMINSQKNI